MLVDDAIADVVVGTLCVSADAIIVIVVPCLLVRKNKLCKVLTRLVGGEKTNDTENWRDRHHNASFPIGAKTFSMSFN